MVFIGHETDCHTLTAGVGIIGISHLESVLVIGVRALKMSKLGLIKYIPVQWRTVSQKKLYSPLLNY